ncbi:MAG: RNA polymerase sigma factor [Lachnospiraceae bacterium]|nr:RNA polymerase sigma factor [Lachnospiraceae bacterium]
MDKKTNEELQALVWKATAGDKKALETLITDVQDLVFNLSLRMLGSFPDAEDATQDILLKMITHLSSFRGDSSFTTWVFRIAVNHLKNYKKHMFAHHAPSFEYYADDIENGNIQDVPDLTQNVEKDILAEELKMSCTNVMLQCLDAESRCIFILGTMFKADSRIAGDILQMTPEAYRQRLSRIRKKMADFLGQYCGEYGSGKCKCTDRVNYAIHNHRINPLRLDYVTASEIPLKTMIETKNAMEDIDNLSQDFSFCKPYQSPEHTKHLLQEFLDSTQLSIIQKTERK